ncbi:MAG: AraC family transcriptional regulator [Bacteroidia bacterium]
MKPITFKIPFTNKELVRFQLDNFPHFYDKLHVHPELQITIILKSEGTLIAGHYIGSFNPDDVFVIGSNLPHVFKNSTDYYQATNNLRAESLSIYPNDQLLRDTILNYKETDAIKKFLKRSQNGLKIIGNIKSIIIARIWKLKTATGINILIQLFELLQLLSESKEIEVLNHHIAASIYNEKEGKRMGAIFRFTVDKSHRSISIEEVATVANMSTTAFCRYFKQHTQKTYISFLNEIRINNACNLLQKKDANIVDVCHLAGFNNLSNFNRTFKKTMNQTPLAYKQAAELR